MFCFQYLYVKTMNTIFSDLNLEQLKCSKNMVCAYFWNSFAGKQCKQQLSMWHHFDILLVCYEKKILTCYLDVIKMQNKVQDKMWALYCYKINLKDLKYHIIYYYVQLQLWSKFKYKNINQINTCPLLRHFVSYFIKFYYWYLYFVITSK